MPLEEVRPEIEQYLLETQPQSRRRRSSKRCGQGQGRDLHLSVDEPSTARGAVRLDVWLDVACLFKTRSEAKRACEGGKVEVNGEHAKPNRAVREGDRIRISRGFGRHQDVIVRIVHRSARQEVRGARPLRRRDAEADRRRRSRCGGSSAPIAPPPRRPGTPDRRRRREIRRFKEDSERPDRRSGVGWAVPRNQEVIRQWKVLHALESSRHGVSIDALADELDVTTRTIRRDLAALQEAGFPLYDERDDDGRVRWRLDGQVLKGLETGFTLAELCALYLSRNLLEAGRRHAVSARPDATRSPGSRRCCRRACGSFSIACRRCSRPSRARAPAAATRRADIVGAAARSDAALPRRDDALSLGVERARQGLPGASVPAGVRAGRAVPARLRARIRRRPDVRRRPDRLGVAREADVHAEAARSATTCSPTRSASTPARRRTWKSNSTRSVAPYVRARVWHASQQVRDERRRRRRADDERLSRLGAAQLDSELGPVRARRRAGVAGRRGPRRSRSGRRAISRALPTSHRTRSDCASRISSRLLRLLVRLLLFFAGPSLIRFYTDWLWFGEVGYQQVYTTMLRGQATLFTIAFAVAFVVAGAEPARWRSARWATCGRCSPRAKGIEVALPGRQQLRTLALGVAHWSSRSSSGSTPPAQWETWLAWRNAVPFGQADPILGRDVGFYVFSLPFLQFVRGLGAGARRARGARLRRRCISCPAA